MYNIHDILEYIIALVNDFAKKFGISEREAYNYINSYNGVDFLTEHYGIIHTLDFNEAIESIIRYCRRYGGKL